MEFRKVLANVLSKLMKEDDKIVLLDADLSKPNGTSVLYKEFPNRCFNCGIAEANMASIAAGLSAYGYKPVIVTFAPFATRRIFDQIAVSIAYAKQNVKIIGTDPGITAELNGGTHMSFEDIALMRTVPGMIVYDAVDDISLESSLESLLLHNGNVYIRMPRKERPRVFNDTYKYTFDKADVVSKGTDITIIACGTLVYEALLAKEELLEQNINAEVINVNTIKPLDEDTILKSLKKTKSCVTCENHSVIGGLYSAVSELCCKKLPMRLGRIGVNDSFGQVGKYNELAKAYNLTKDDIVKEAKKQLNILN